MTIKHTIKQLALKLGVEMDRYIPERSQHARMFKLLSHHGIDTVIDVGANDGGFGRFLREDGFHGGILSFEPLEDAHCSLTAAAAGERMLQMDGIFFRTGNIPKISEHRL